MLSHAIISAFLARMPDPEPILAAYSIAFYLHATLGSPVWACQFVAISFIKDRASTLRLFIFSTQTFLLVAWFWALIGLTPVGITFFVKVFGFRQKSPQSTLWGTTSAISDTSVSRSVDP